jgi:hypothetical protein
MTNGTEEAKCPETSSHQSHFPNENPKWTTLGFNISLRGDKLLTNRASYDGNEDYRLMCQWAGKSERRDRARGSWTLFTYLEE